MFWSSPAYTGVTPPILGIITSSKELQPVAVLVIVQRNTELPAVVVLIVKFDVGDDGVAIVNPVPEVTVQRPVSPACNALPDRAYVPGHKGEKSAPALAVGVALTITLTSSYTSDPSRQVVDMRNL